MNVVVTAIIEESKSYHETFIDNYSINKRKGIIINW